MILPGNRYEDITPVTGAVSGPSSGGRRRDRHFAASGLVETTATNHDAGEPWWGWRLMRSRRAKGKWFGSIMAQFSFFFHHHSIHSYTKYQSNKWNYGDIMNLRREFSCRSWIWKWRKFSNSGRRATWSISQTRSPPPCVYACIRSEYVPKVLFTLKKYFEISIVP